MKTLNDTSSVVVSGGTETASLTIAANSKAFKELISGIYSDKPFAISRELFSNAVDSHVEAGTPDRPFDVQVPNLLEPTFSVRDYGVSMPHEMMMTVYSTLFESTKDNQDDDTANNYTGKFGLGSKTPFAYTDAFQVTTYLDGTMRNYDIFLDKGIPTISMFMSTTTDEENGVLITFPVENDDHKDFIRAIRESCEGLDVLPNFLNSSLEIEKKEPTYTGDNWKMYASEEDSYHRTAKEKLRVRQGTVIYPISKTSLNIYDDDLNEIDSSIFSMNIVVTVPIGTLEVNTAREALSYDDRTIKNLKEALRGIYSSVVEVLSEGKEDNKTYYEFCLWVKSARDRIEDNLYNSIFPNLKFRGKKAQAYLTAELPKYLVESTHMIGDIETTRKYTEYSAGLMFCHYAASERGLKTMSFRPDRNIVKKHRWESTKSCITVQLNEKLVIVYEDTRENVSLQASKIKKLSNDLDRTNSILWIKGAIDNPLKEIFRIVSKLGYPPVSIINMNTLERLPKSEAFTADDIPNDFYRKYRHGDFEYVGFETEVPEQAYYVNLFRKDVVFENRGHSMYDMVKAYGKLKELGLVEDRPIVGVNKSYANKIKHFPEWMDLEKVVREAAPLAVSADDVYKGMMNKLLFDRINNSIQDRLMTMLKDCDGNFDRYYTKWEKATEGLDLRWKLKQAAKQTYIWELYSEWRKFDVAMDEGKYSSDLTNLSGFISDEKAKADHPEAVLQAEKDTRVYRRLLKQFKKEFPLLMHINVNQGSLNETRRYLKLID